MRFLALVLGSALFGFAFGLIAGALITHITIMRPSKPAILFETLAPLPVITTVPQVLKDCEVYNTGKGGIPLDEVPTFHITGNGVRDLKVKGIDRSDALANAHFTVWTQEEWQAFLDAGGYEAMEKAR